MHTHDMVPFEVVLHKYSIRLGTIHTVEQVKPRILFRKFIGYTGLRVANSTEAFSGYASVGLRACNNLGNVELLI